MMKRQLSCSRMVKIKLGPWKIATLMETGRWTMMLMTRVPLLVQHPPFSLAPHHAVLGTSEKLLNDAKNPQ